VLCPPKTARSERAIALDRTTVAVLRAHKAAQEAERAALGKDYHDSGYVFTYLDVAALLAQSLDLACQVRSRWSAQTLELAGWVRAPIGSVVRSWARRASRSSPSNDADRGCRRPGGDQIDQDGRHLDRQVGDQGG
jgi:hypothetical protein